MKRVFIVIFAGVCLAALGDLQQELAELSVELSSLYDQLPAGEEGQLPSPHLINRDAFTLLSSKYNVNAPLENNIPLVRNSVEVMQAAVVWQMLSYNDFFKLPLDALDATGQVFGVNQRSYVDLQRTVNKDLYARLAPINVDVTTLTSNIGGLDASCGYHALKNGIYCMRAILTKDRSAEQAELDKLLDLNTTLELFGSPKANAAVLLKDEVGRWRSNIILERRREAVGFLLSELITTSYFLIDLPQPGDKLWNIYKQVIQTYITSFNNSVVKAVALTGSFTFDDEMSRDDILTVIGSIDSLEGWSAQDIAAAKQVNNLNKYIKNVSPLEVKIELPDGGLAWSKLEANITKKTGQPFVLNGDWLNDKDINFLFNIEKNQGGLLDGIDVGISIIESSGEINDPDFNPTLNKALNDLKKKDSFAHIVIIKPTGDGGPGAQGPHWIVGVINKVAGKTQFILADSENRSRYNEIDDPSLPVGALSRQLL